MIIGAAVIAAGLLAGCRVEEDGRPLIVNKGEYSGQQDTNLTPAQIEALNQRVRTQGVGDSVSGGPGGVERDAAAAPPVSSAAPGGRAQPASAPLPESTLEQRMRMQSGQ